MPRSWRRSLLLAILTILPACARAQAPDDLAVEMKRRLPLKNSSDADAIRALDRGIDDMLRSPLARELARRFIETPLIVPVTLIDNDGLRGTYNFRLVEADVSCRYANIWTAESIGPMLAHEVLGHALKFYEANREDAVEALPYWLGDEEFAYLVGWIVQSEVRNAPESNRDAYLEDPGQFESILHRLNPTYWRLMTIEELRDPLLGLTSRRQVLQRRFPEAEQQSQMAHSWDPVMKRLTRTKGVAKETFDQLKRNEKWWDKNLKDTAQALAEVEAYLKKFSVSAFYFEVVGAARTPFFTRTQAEINVLRRRLQALRAGAPAAREAQAAGPLPGAALEINWEELKTLRDW